MPQNIKEEELIKSNIEISLNNKNLEVVIKNDTNNTYVILDGKNGDVLDVLQLLTMNFNDKEFKKFFKDKFGNEVINI